VNPPRLVWHHSGLCCSLTRGAGRLGKQVQKVQTALTEVFRLLPRLRPFPNGSTVSERQAEVIFRGEVASVYVPDAR